MKEKEIRIIHLIDEADEILDNKFRIGSCCLFFNTDDFRDILDKMRAILPDDIKRAEMILKRRDDIYLDAQNRADRIINEAQTKAASILSENELIRAVKEKAATIQEQVKDNCEEMKNKAAEESENVRRTAYQEAVQTKEGAKAYVEELLATLEHDIDKVHKHIKNCQEYLLQKNKEETANSTKETIARNK